MNLITELNQELGMTILMVTHDDSIAGHAQRLVHLLDGHVIRGDKEIAGTMA
jgi:putative ABC transport system ATP-binding protein